MMRPNHLNLDTVRRGAPWWNVWEALAISIIGTAVLGGLLFVLSDNIWWVGVAGILSLIGGGARLGSRVGEPEPLYGALLAILYFGIAAGILFGGTLAEALPEPLPGLGRGDSTFYFVCPLLLLVGGVTGSIIGGRMGQRRAEE